MRLVVQILLALGTFFLAPFAFPFLLVPFTPAYWTSLVAGSPRGMYVAVVFPIGAFGIIALWTSILVSPAFLSRRQILKRLVIAGLFGGAISAMTFLVWMVQQRFSSHDYLRLLGDAWIYGGPVIVAVWNCYRFLKKPNQPPLPTSGLRRAAADL